ncbi:MAG: primosomal protein N' [Prevotella sp.]|jgi:primosomal protein N' (replication factor Y)|nr:primosomal protein N' [Prevotella sp.]
MLLADVILPLPIDRLYTYSVAEKDGGIQAGCRAIVQFGAKKYYTAIVSRVYKSPEEKADVKEIIASLDESPIVLSSQLAFWEWLSSYYMCSMGDVYKAAIPSALKIESETCIFRSGTFQSELPLTPTEQRIFYALSEMQGTKLSELERTLKLKNIIPHIKSLSDKQAIRLSENLTNDYASKTETGVYLAMDFGEKELNLLLDSLSRAKKQQKLLLDFLSYRETSGLKQQFVIPKKELLEKSGVSSAILDALVGRGVFAQVIYEVSRFDYGKANLDGLNSLNEEQTEACRQIRQYFETHPVVLLHGVTSSGKTEIYIHLIKEAISAGKQALYLLPEIALTTQITERLKAVFGDNLLVYHSRFSDNERAEVWNTLLTKGERKVVLGARSAIFLPFSNLDLIVADEEHDASYKQQDPAPRYHARNAAIVLANIHQAKVLLGTATPAVETYYNALSGKYGLVSLNRRYEHIELPRILPVNTKEMKRKKQMKHVLSPPLIAEMTDALQRKEQVILFRNRRGFAPLLECKTCAWTPTCAQCDVSLTYHKGQRTMVCHYCGAVYAVPALCPDCGTPSLEVLGYGTERIEEEVRELFPEAAVARMDMDTTRSKRAYEKIISGLEKREIDVLIGTQMISKGLDFDNVSIVGILNADSSLNFPDFRAHEKTFQLMTQVSGRAGRKNRQGLVLLQTAQPEHPVIGCIINNDYAGLYNMQLAERQLFRYPPFYRLISIILKGRDEQALEAAAKQFAAALSATFGDRTLGPTKPPVSRIQSLYIRHILLKIENNASTQKVREAIRFHRQQVFSLPVNRSVLVYFDVDPL